MSVITEKIKTLCKNKNIALEDLLSRADITTDEFEILDRSDKIPSLAWLIKISRVLSVRLGTFLDDYEEIGPVINRAKDSLNTENAHKLTTSNNSHLTFHSLATEKVGKNFEPFLVKIDPNQNNVTTPFSYEGEEFIYVLEGKVSIKYGIENHTLEQGDSIYYDSIVSHLITSANEESATILVIVYYPL